MGTVTVTHCRSCNIKLDENTTMYENKGFNKRQKMGRCISCYKINKAAQNRKRKHKISLEQFNELYLLQQGGCAICRTKISESESHVDHNHRKKFIRGLLCINCNIALGHLKENEKIILNMLEYLKKHNWKMVA